MTELAGKKVFITGATQGIGFAIAKRLSETGAKVFMNGTNEEKAIRAAEQKAERELTTSGSSTT